ncbi:MAG: hypothetical protein KJS68_15685, partial [Alphaproteobacteria bacterium]|nr:hypothetical protein [Alphaproteobacteria bacterium]
GHSTIVVLASLGIAVTATALQGQFVSFPSIGGLGDALVSVTFLLTIALMNVVILSAPLTSMGCDVLSRR